MAKAVDLLSGDASLRDQRTDDDLIRQGASSELVRKLHYQYEEW